MSAFSNRLDQCLPRLGSNDPTLTTLDLRNNSIGDEGVGRLATALATNSTLTSLDLHNNNIGDEGAGRLAATIATNSTLTKLDLSLNSIRAEGAVRLAAALATNSTLTTLDFHKNNISDDGEKLLAMALSTTRLFANDRTLTTLELSYNNIDDEGAGRLATALAINSVLTQLHLAHNTLDDEGVGRLATALVTNSTLTSLDLCWNNIGDEGARRLATALVLNSTLTSLDLQSNNIVAGGAGCLATALATNSTLTALYLYNNNIGDEGAGRLKTALASNSTLTKLYLDGNNISKSLHNSTTEIVHLNTLLSPTSLDPRSFNQLFNNNTSLSFSTHPVLNSSNILHLPFKQFPRQFTSFDFRNQPRLTIIPPNLGYLDPTFTKTILFDVHNLLPSLRPFAQDASTIIQYAKAMLEDTLIDLNQVKLMVVGRAASGKTTLVRRFYGKQYDASLQSTDGIDLGDFTFQGMKFSTWDFGGQKVYRYTHQLFLGDNTIYLLLFKLTDPLASTLSELRFWLNSIGSRTKNPTLILVGTHLDQVRTHRIDVTSLISSMLQTLTQDNPTLISQTPVFQVNCIPGGENSIPPLLTHLVSVAQRVQVRAPKSFSIAEQYFSQLHHLNPPVITYREAILSLSKQLSDHTPQEIHSTLSILADFGSISVFHQPRTPTEGIIVFRPQWITTLFSSIITTHHTFVNSDYGVIPQDIILQQIWKDPIQYPPDKHESFLHVLTELQVIFPFVERLQPKYFIPCRLREEAPDLTYHLSHQMLVDHPLSFQRVFKLATSVPIAIIPPLLIELLRRGELLARWQQGGVARVIDAGGQTVWVHLYRSSAHSITLQMWGRSIKSCAPWLRSLSMLMENRLKEFYNVNFETLIPCKDCESDGNQGYFYESAIHQAIFRDRNLVPCDGIMKHRMRLDSLAPDLIYQDLSDEGFIFDFHKFEMVKELGSGAFGKVFLMSLDIQDEHLASNYPVSSSSISSIKTTHYAVKILDQALSDKSHLSSKEVFLEFKREVFLMSTLDHPYVLRLFGICKSPLAMVMEVASGGDLYAQLTDPLGLKHKIFNFTTAVKEHLTKYMEGPSNIHRALYIIERYSSLNLELQSILKHSCHKFLHIQVGNLKNRGIDLNQIGCPLQFILKLKEEDPRDEILESLQLKYVQDYLGLDRLQIEACLCPPLLPLNAIGNEKAFQTAQSAFEDWKQLAIRYNLNPDQISQLSISFFTSLQSVYQNPTNPAGYRRLESILDQVQSLEKEQRSTLCPITFPLQLKIAAEIVLGIIYLHDLQPPMVHRDLKTPNIFLTSSLINFPPNDLNAWKAPLTKVADFGLSVRMVRSGQLQMRDRNDNDPLLNINPAWAAPELLRGEQYTNAIDVYAVGIILWELLLRETPFNEILLEDAIKSQILQGYRPLIPQSIIDHPQFALYIKLMQRCWSQHPEDRPCINLVYQELMAIIEADQTSQFLKDILPPSQSMGGQEEHSLPRQWYQVHPVDIPFVPLQVDTKDQLPHVTCMITPFQTEEFWLGFDNGVVAHAKYEVHTLSLDMLACQDADRHPSRVTTIICSLGQLQYGTIWIGSEDGLLSVWSSQREDCGAISESSSFKSNFLIFSGEKKKPVYSSLKQKLFRGKSSRSNTYWVEFEYGNISFYTAQSKVKPKARLSLKSDVTDIRFQSETRELYIYHKTRDHLFILSSVDGLNPSMPMEDCYRIIKTSFSSLRSHPTATLKRLSSRQFDSVRAGKTFKVKIGIQSLLPLDHSVLCATHDFSISEWRLKSTADEHGLHETYSLEPCRSFRLNVSDIKSSLQVMLGFLRVNHRTLWFAIGNRWIVFDLDNQNSSSISTVCSSNGDKMISLLLVRRAHFDQVYTGDESGRLIVWHPQPAPLSDPSDIAPLLIPIEHRVLNLTQSPVDALAYLSPNHLWLGTCQSELISWNVATQARDAEESQPFHHHPHLRPNREITTLMNVKDSRGSAVMWCLSREKKFLRFSGLKSLYGVYQEPIPADFLIDLAHLKRDDQPIGSGGFGKVYRGHYFNNPVAVKVLNLALNTTLLTQELSSWCTFRHPNLVTLIGYATKPEALIVMELMDGSLYQVIYQGAPLDLKEKLWIARGIATGLSYIHARHTVHQDLKSPNVLIRKGGRGESRLEVKIADFGATRLMDMMDENSEQVKSLYWHAPELFTTYATPASDVYAMGMVFYELFMRELPFRRIQTFDALKAELCQQQLRPSMNAEKMGLSPQVAQPIMDLISSCWHHESYLRPTSASVSHQLNQPPFINLSPLDEVIPLPSLSSSSQRIDYFDIKSDQLQFG